MLDILNVNLYFILNLLPLILILAVIFLFGRFFAMATAAWLYRKGALGGTRSGAITASALVWLAAIVLLPIEHSVWVAAASIGVHGIVWVQRKAI